MTLSRREVYLPAHGCNGGHRATTLADRGARPALVRRQLEELERQRDEQVGRGLIRMVERLEDRLERERGTDPTSPTMQTPARRWRELIGRFTGGDESIYRSLPEMYRKEGAQSGLARLV